MFKKEKNELKRLLSVACCLIIIVGLAGCGGGGSDLDLLGDLQTVITPPPGGSDQNRAPVTTTGDATITLDVGKSKTYILVDTTWFSDPDGDRLRITARSNSNRIATADLSSNSRLEITARSGGQATITVTATDPDGLTASVYITVNVNETPPEIVFETNDLCNDGIDVKMRFFHRQGSTFRGWATDVKIAGGSDTVTTVSCNYSNVDNVCIGARAIHPTTGARWYWGTDIDRSESCAAGEKCCFACPESGTKRQTVEFNCPGW